MPAQALRVAIYTRQSRRSDDEFSSCDAQFAICHAFIESQRSEGWQWSGVRYDDDGELGEGLDRPELSDLLCDLRAGKIDVVVIHRLDRLSRKVMDLTKLHFSTGRRRCSRWLPHSSRRPVKNDLRTSVRSKHCRRRKPGKNQGTQKGSVEPLEPLLPAFFVFCQPCKGFASLGGYPPDLSVSHLIFAEGTPTFPLARREEHSKTLALSA